MPLPRPRQLVLDPRSNGFAGVCARAFYDPVAQICAGARLFRKRQSNLQRWRGGRQFLGPPARRTDRSEEHTSELQSLMRISYAVFCLKKKNQKNSNTPEAINIQSIQYLYDSVYDSGI